ncbi:anaerobic sulfatase maturase, partial [Salmonella enterica subsp. arizonae]|nr:anaerobic sulfatase maturase [Salmonella enterica subsp. arizonae]
MSGKSCQVMVKPTGSVCNLDCKYCFYLEKEKLYPDRKNHYKMSEETLELFI